MSAIPHARPAALRTTAIPAARPYPRARTMPRGGITATGLCRFAIGVFMTSVALHVAAGFGGHLLIEEARRAAIRADRRADRAELATTALREQIDDIQSADAIERWAALNGFVSSYVATDGDAAEK